MKQSQTTLVSNIEVMPGSHLLWLQAPEIAAVARPGQFVMVRCGEETTLPRPLSIHQTAGDKLALLFTVVGRGTQWLCRRQPGEKVNMFGPLGNGFTIHPDSTDLLLVAGGIGIAPLRFLADEAVRQGKRVTLLYGTPDKNRYPENLLPGGIAMVAATEDGATGKRGRATEFLPECIDRADQVFACGPVGMYHALADYSRQFPIVKTAQISLEMRMGCGLGVCYGCTVKTKDGLKQVCQDGPVFKLEDILWGELSG